jgi:hypothetical protein
VRGEDARFYLLIYYFLNLIFGKVRIGKWVGGGEGGGGRLVLI